MEEFKKKAEELFNRHPEFNRFYVNSLSWDTSGVQYTVVFYHKEYDYNKIAPMGKGSSEQEAIDSLVNEIKHLLV